MRNKSKTRKVFRTETEDRKCFPDIETARPEYAIYPELCSSSSHTFMYVDNFETRDYQMEISLSSVTKNTLIIIPTGLGKTFIAAMIIINFYRWFPTGKIIFIATSRPLVHQQTEAIKQLNIISKKDIAVLTGGINQQTRASYWTNSKVFFATPQTVQIDIERGVCPVSQVVLIVVDEAHHARGNHSYCQIVRKIASVTKFFRLVALTATPGSTVYDIQQVIFNLLISQIEIRTDDDCSKYIHTRNIQSIIIQDAPGVAELSARLNSILQEYLEKLLKMSLVTTKDPTRTSKGKIALLMKTQHSGEACIAIKQSIRLLNLREKLENYSIPFFTHDLEEYVNSKDRPIDDTNDELKMLLLAAKQSPQIDPKMEKLCEVVVNFLETSSEKSKVIVFCSFRNVVKEIVKNLTDASPIVKCAEFVGQSSSAAGFNGMNQPKQLKVMDLFKRGIINVLISTSIGEEGLDIGEVDLIICYDVQKSSTRTIQRMGRTGRHKDGNVIFLLSEASKNLLHNAEKAPDSTSNLIAKNMSDFVFYKDCPKMNENKLTIIFKKFTAEELKNYEKQINKEKEIKRAVLLTSELEELHEHHGDSLIYNKLDLASCTDYIASAVFCSKINMSNESILLSDIYSEILQSSIQCSPLKSLSLSPQFTNDRKKEADSLSLIDENLNLDESKERSPFEIDESSSQTKFSNFSPSSSQKKPEKISVRKLLNLDISTDTSASESEYEYDIFSLKNKKKKKSKNEKESEIESLKKSARNDVRDEIFQMIDQVKDNRQPTEKKKLSLLAEIEEISSDSKGNDPSENFSRVPNKPSEIVIDDDDDSGFIPPNTRSITSSTSGSSTGHFTVLPKKSDGKKTKEKSISLLSNSDDDYEEEEEMTSLSGFIVNSSEDVQDSHMLLRKVRRSYDSESSDDGYRKSRKNDHSKFNINLSKIDADEEESNDDVEPLNEDEIAEMTQHFSNQRNSIIDRQKPSKQSTFFHIEEEDKNGGFDDDDDDAFPVNPDEGTIQHFTNTNFTTDNQKSGFDNEKKIIQVSSESTEHSQIADENHENYQDEHDNHDEQENHDYLHMNRSNHHDEHTNHFNFLSNHQDEPEIHNDDHSNHQDEHMNHFNFLSNHQDEQENHNDENSNHYSEHTNHFNFHSNHQDEPEIHNDENSNHYSEHTNHFDIHSNHHSEHSDPPPNVEHHSLLRIFTPTDLERIIQQEDETNPNANSRHSTYLNSSSDDDLDAVMESSSFVSTSSELIASESSESEGENEIEISPMRHRSQGQEAKKSSFFHRMMEEEDSESDTKIGGRVTDSESDDDFIGEKDKERPKISAENVLYVPLSQLINKEGDTLNLRKVEIPQKQENGSSSNEMSDFEDSSD